MKPYAFSNLRESKLVYTYRLSRVRRVIENIFGICASRFHVLHRPIIAKVQTKSIVALHNFLMHTNSVDGSHVYCPQTFVDQDGPEGLRPGEWRQDINNINGLTEIRNVGASNTYGEDAKLVCQQFTNYCNNERDVYWQWQIVHRSR